MQHQNDKGMNTHNYNGHHLDLRLWKGKGDGINVLSDCTEQKIHNRRQRQSTKKLRYTKE